jgi:hypothetical protein
MVNYSIIPDGRAGFMVEVRDSDGGVEIKRGFKTTAEARAWVEEQQAEKIKRGDA